MNVNTKEMRKAASFGARNNLELEIKIGSTKKLCYKYTILEQSLNQKIFLS